MKVLMFHSCQPTTPRVLPPILQHYTFSKNTFMWYRKMSRNSKRQSFFHPL